jgi:hypothetical protein
MTLNLYACRCGLTLTLTPGEVLECCQDPAPLDIKFASPPAENDEWR